MLQFLANAIDNPLRRKIQPPDKTAIRHGIKEGMNVLEIGPGNGRYTIEAARQVGQNGKVTTIDIEERMIERVKNRMKNEGIKNIETQVANVYKLPYQDNSFDLIYMIAVFNEIPHQGDALKEFYRVLKPKGLLVFSELLLDPDYPLAKTLIGKVEKYPFRLKEKIGNFFHYTLKFEKI
ncbi:unnamed protein product [marine sediment metagenome]|uniref:Arsenite methyltransferase n=1 Tax=marine sediment metagenome TaxID=412755 RepID=X0ZY73_9ZZZZ